MRERNRNTIRVSCESRCEAAATKRTRRARRDRQETPGDTPSPLRPLLLDALVYRTRPTVSTASGALRRWWDRGVRNSVRWRDVPGRQVLRSVIAVLLLAALASACRNSRAATAPPPAAAPPTASHPATASPP